MKHISAHNGPDRMPTQQLLEIINEQTVQGEHELYIEASGQHNIGGPLWCKEKKQIKIFVKNPGQRVAAMCLPGSEVIIEGSAPADTGWLNSGGTIIVKGDSGDTTGHCAASGKIYIGGRVGTRSGSLMKRDPLYSEPELWVLKNSGSFSFEFMSGGKAIVCGWQCEAEETVLGYRACVGMVGGVIYYRGRVEGVSQRDVKLESLNDGDIDFLRSNMPIYLGSICRKDLSTELSDWSQWAKIVPLNFDERPKMAEINIAAFRGDKWPDGGIFQGLVNDDTVVAPLVACGNLRIHSGFAIPSNCVKCQQCVKNCPRGAINADLQFNSNNCHGCGLCRAVCPVID